MAVVPPSGYYVMVIDLSLTMVSSDQAMLTAPVAAPLGTSTVMLVAVALVTGPAMVEPPREVKATLGTFWPLAPKRSVPLMVMVLPMTPLAPMAVGFSVMVWTPSIRNRGSPPGTRMVASTPPVALARVAQGATGLWTAHFFRYLGGGVAPSKQILMPLVGRTGDEVGHVDVGGGDEGRAVGGDVGGHHLESLGRAVQLARPGGHGQGPRRDPPEGTVTVTVWAGALAVAGAATAA